MFLAFFSLWFDENGSSVPWCPPPPPPVYAFRESQNLKYVIKHRSNKILWFLLQFSKMMLYWLYPHNTVIYFFIGRVGVEKTALI